MKGKEKKNNKYDKNKKKDALLTEKRSASHIKLKLKILRLFLEAPD